MTELKRQATGTFEVNLQPLEGYAPGEDGVLLGRMSIDKEFAGDIRDRLRDFAPCQAGKGSRFSLGRTLRMGLTIARSRFSGAAK